MRQLVLMVVAAFAATALIEPAAAASPYPTVTSPGFTFQSSCVGEVNVYSEMRFSSSRTTVAWGLYEKTKVKHYNELRIDYTINCEGYFVTSATGQGGVDRRVSVGTSVTTSVSNENGDLFTTTQAYDDPQSCYYDGITLMGCTIHIVTEPTIVHSETVTGASSIPREVNACGVTGGLKARNDGALVPGLLLVEADIDALEACKLTTIQWGGGALMADVLDAFLSGGGSFDVCDIEPHACDPGDPCESSCGLVGQLESIVEAGRDSGHAAAAAVVAAAEGALQEVGDDDLPGAPLAQALLQAILDSLDGNQKPTQALNELLEPFI